MTLGMALKHWWNGTYPTVEQMFNDQYGGFCRSAVHCTVCYEKLKGDPMSCGDSNCVKVVNIDYMDEAISKIRYYQPPEYQERLQAIKDRAKALGVLSMEVD